MFSFAICETWRCSEALNLHLRLEDVPCGARNIVVLYDLELLCLGTENFGDVNQRGNMCVNRNTAIVYSRPRESPPSHHCSFSSEGNTYSYLDGGEWIGMKRPIPIFLGLFSHTDTFCTTPQFWCIILINPSLLIPAERRLANVTMLGSFFIVKDT